MFLLKVAWCYHRHCLAFSPCGRLLASAQARSVMLWVVKGRRLEQTIEAPGTVLALAFAPEGSRLVVSCGDRTPHGRLYEVVTGRLLRRFRGDFSTGGFAFSSDGRVLAGAHKYIHRWVMPAGRKAPTLAGHEWCSWCLAFSPDGRWLASGGSDRTARLWELARSRERAALPHRTDVFGVAFASNGGTLATTNGRNVELWDLQT